MLPRHRTQKTFAPIGGFVLLQHTDEIATMSIDLLAAVKQVKIPHDPDQKLMLRIGLHTGEPCWSSCGYTT